MNFLLDALMLLDIRCVRRRTKTQMRSCTLPLALQNPPIVLPQSKHSESASEPASLTHTSWNQGFFFFFFMEQSKMEIHNDIQANPHPPCLILLELSKKSLVY